jgi:hypothetical protein
VAAPGPSGAAPGPAAAGLAGRQPGGAPDAGPRGAANGQAPQRGAVTEAAPSPPAQPSGLVPRPAPSPAHLTTARQWRLQLIQPTNITRGIVTGIADAWRQHQREVIAVAFLAIAGLIFKWPIWFVGPLLWLIGAGIALSSKLWSNLDKWVAVPGLVVLVIVGTVIGVSLGGARTHAAAYGDEAMADAAMLFRAGALLGAVYLAWRMHRGRRSRAVPPWVRRRA